MLILFSKKNQIPIFMISINSISLEGAVNINLLNGIMNIHPCIYLIVFYNLLSLYIGFLKNKKLSLEFTLYSFTVLLFLGSFWAAQELSWGGWWSWDITECTILYIYVYLIYMYHLKIQSKVLDLLFLFIAAFMLNKTNLIISVHSFETSYDNNYIVFVFGLVWLGFFFKKKKNFTFFICVYTFNYLYIYLYIYLIYYIFYKKILGVTFSFFNFFQFLSTFSKKHLIFFFVIFLYFTVYSYFYYYKYTNFFFLSEFYFNTDCFYFFNQQFTKPKLIYKNSFRFSFDFFFFFKKINFFICTFNFFIFFIILFKKKRNFFNL